MFIAGVNITRATSIARTSILLISRSWFYLALPITFAGMIVIIVMQIIQEIKKYTRK
jgi:TRAP-type C4-dicarboxylate transport system permease small subunit